MQKFTSPLCLPNSRVLITLTEADCVKEAGQSIMLVIEFPLIASIFSDN